MMTDDRAVIAVVERSAIAMAIARAAASLRRAASRSAALTALQPVLEASRTRPGVVVLGAVSTHVLVMGAIARPDGFYWLLLPALFAAAGLVLLLMGNAERP